MIKHKKITKKLLLVSFSIAIFLPSIAFSEPIDEKEFGKAMEKFLQKDENIEKISNSLERYFRKKQQERFKAEADKLNKQFQNPTKIDIGSSYIKGPKNAPITIVEFSEFQCPFCKRGTLTMHSIMKEYDGKVNWVFKHLPLPFHPHAKSASIAALAAGEQGKFWEMHDKLFENQSTLGENLYLKLAKDLKLDMAKFKADLKTLKLSKKVEEDLALAKELGINGTPGYFINGVQIKGAQPLPVFKSIIDKWLDIKKSKAKK